MIVDPSKASPFGCVIALLGILSLIFSGFLWRGFYLATKLEGSDKSAALMQDFGIWGAVATVLGFVIIVVGWRMALNSDMSAPNDPDKPSARF